jgi:hypothetical protein
MSRYFAIREILKGIVTAIPESGRFERPRNHCSGMEGILSTASGVISLDASSDHISQPFLHADRSWLAQNSGAFKAPPYKTMSSV